MNKPLHLPATISFIPTDTLNAHVRLQDGEYHIGISEAFESSILTAMNAIVESSNVLPWLSLDNGERSKGAITLSRFCMEFVLAHEQGHIIGGHVDQLALEESGSDGLAEFGLAERDDQIESQFDERSHAWEYEADLIGASLLDQHIDDLIASVKAQRLSKDEHTFLGDPAIAVEHIGALTITALYVLFRVLRQTADELELHGHHPDPLVRAFACRDVIFHRLVARYDFDHDRFKELLIYHLESFDGALEDLSYRASQLADDDGVSEVNEALETLKTLQFKYHDVTARTRKVTWSKSQTE